MAARARVAAPPQVRWFRSLPEALPAGGWSPRVEEVLAHSRITRYPQAAAPLPALVQEPLHSPNLQRRLLRMRLGRRPFERFKPSGLRQQLLVAVPLEVLRELKRQAQKQPLSLAAPS